MAGSAIHGCFVNFNGLKRKAATKNLVRHNHGQKVPRLGWPDHGRGITPGQAGFVTARFVLRQLLSFWRKSPIDIENYGETRPHCIIKIQTKFIELRQSYRSYQQNSPEQKGEFRKRMENANKDLPLVYFLLWPSCLNKKRYNNEAYLLSWDWVIFFRKKNCGFSISSDAKQYANDRRQDYIECRLLLNPWFCIVITFMAISVE